MLLCTDVLQHSGYGGGSDIASPCSCFHGLWLYLYGSLKLMANAYINCMWQEETPDPGVIKSSFSSLISFFLSLA